VQLKPSHISRLLVIFVDYILTKRHICNNLDIFLDNLMLSGLSKKRKKR